MKVPINWLPIACLAIALILSVASLFSPIWRIQTSRTVQINANATVNAFYYPSQYLVAEDPSANITEQFLISDLGGSNTDIGGIASTFSLTYSLAAAGIIVVIIALGLAIANVFGKPMLKYLWITALIGAILMFVGTAYFVAAAPSPLSTLGTLVPQDIVSVLPQGVVSVPGNTISGVWGSNTSWTWGSGIGLIFLFTASLFAGSAMLLIRAIQEKMKPRVISF